MLNVRIDHAEIKKPKQACRQLPGCAQIETDPEI